MPFDEDEPGCLGFLVFVMILVLMVAFVALYGEWLMSLW